MATTGRYSELPRSLHEVSSPRPHVYDVHVEGPRRDVVRVLLDGMLVFDGPLPAPRPGKLFTRNFLGGKGFCGEVTSIGPFGA